VNLITVATLLGLLSVVLLGPASVWLAEAAWVTRSPRAAVIMWQCIGVGAVVSGIGTGLAVAVYRYHVGFASGVRELAAGLVSGHPLQGLGLPDALGLTLAADLLIVLVVVSCSFAASTIRSRARHRRLLDLLAKRSAELPGTDLIDDDRALAYCLPGRRPRIVISEGARRLLTPPQLRAVIEHERGHAQAHHALVLLPMVGIRKIFGWMPYARLAPREIACLLEMSADDFSARRSDPVSLATALVHMATSGQVPACALAVSGNPVPRRVSRLLAASRTSKTAALMAGLVAGAVVVAPVVVIALS
jgi:Zn-dependent protease with chaperone function